MSEHRTSNPSNDLATNRDKVLRGEVVLVTTGRLREMQAMAIAREGIGEGDYHWHWAAVLNELVARRTGALPAVETSAATSADPNRCRTGKWIDGRLRQCGFDEDHDGAHAVVVDGRLIQWGEYGAEKASEQPRERTSFERFVDDELPEIPPENGSEGTP